jgi:DNA-binding GntR family transcriptional regulator
VATIDRDKWGFRSIAEDIREHIAAGRLKRPPPRSRACPQCGEPLAAVALKPGDQLLSRSQLAAAYDVSESTIGNTLRILHAAGDTVGEQGVGVYVRPPPDAGQSDAPAP